ncbi:rod shape-determining protein MreC [Porphyromonas levii]|uniref:Cell shape-determining protein MreC n=1 Tax=Porphyromonas levii TaxID=28114 RepID=A0A4Y8WQR7_9PORP|nr:rod shape-determining protein MreC [Porphyromonas levii]MBR8702647.1 hypothetical protein [Porphyromonas levii]MBR8712709.1 hypothetical protein [Porphyromonas levii]MBR8714794.1 hypothetical protein [Porphyromonas levii]MBR8727242.1 hypothetical protein [Porphyromonas levii]MBR8729007.1 hypothetical protein [Porphyromonas levii]
MNRLLEFLRSNIHLIIFVLLEVGAFVWLFRGSTYHESVFLSSANRATGAVIEYANKSNEYIGLRDANIALMERAAQLEMENQQLKYQLKRLEVDSLAWQRLSTDSIIRPFPYHYEVAQVVGTTLFGGDNYLTIDIGSKDGVYNDMGVLSNLGVVGVVKTTGQKYAKVIPLVNRNFNLNCKPSPQSQFVGTLAWDGKDLEHSLLTNLPKHAPYNKGDSVVTSGYSSIFPEGLFVGTVEGEGDSPNDNFRALRIKLGAPFATLKYIYVVQNFEREEREEIERTENE